MKTFRAAFGSLIIAGLVGVAGACNNDLLTPSPAAPAGTTTGEITGGGEITGTGSGVSLALAASLRVRCERRSGRSKISVDANNVTPRNGTFRARVRAAGGTATSGLKRAIGDEVEFDFDSNTERGATRIAANFIQRRAGADVIGQLLNAQGNVVASRGVDCDFRQ